MAAELCSVSVKFVYDRPLNGNFEILSVGRGILVVSRSGALAAVLLTSPLGRANASRGSTGSFCRPLPPVRITIVYNSFLYYNSFLHVN